MADPVRWESIEGIAKVVLNRPKAYNAFDSEMVSMLADGLAGVAGDPQVKGVVITGEGAAFSAGGDLRWLADSGRTPGAVFHVLAAKYHQAILELRRMPKPVVAAINGLAAGGGFSMALACDFRVMETSATLRQGYTSNGLSIDGGGTFTLSRMVGMAKAMEIAALDRPISAEQALGWGLVTEVTEDGKSVERAVDLAQEVNRIPLSSFAACKQLITDAFDTSFETQLEKEREFLARCADHPNGREGVAAFLEKRKPMYT
jgi:2-(1,2-epoxy-1,2-dihydrophenyl)acetyl-CoA isomerase